MTDDKRFNTYCVWNNLDDSIVAIDLPAKRCAELIGVTMSSFYRYVTTRGNGVWTVIRSDMIGGDDDADWVV